MADTPNPGRRKTRTRQHVIADLGVNHVERQILLAGYTAERIYYDYGLDLWVSTFGDTGEVENGQIGVQVKATDNVAFSLDRTTIALRVSVADLNYWMFEREMVVLALYDANGDVAYWLDVQAHAPDDDGVGQTVTLHIPVGNRIDVAGVRTWRERKEQGRAGRP